MTGERRERPCPLGCGDRTVDVPNHLRHHCPVAERARESEHRCPECGSRVRGVRTAGPSDHRIVPCGHRAPLEIRQARMIEVRPDGGQVIERSSRLGPCAGCENIAPLRDGLCAVCRHGGLVGGAR